MIGEEMRTSLNKRIKLLSSVESTFLKKIFKNCVHSAHMTSILKKCAHCLEKCARKIFRAYSNVSSLESISSLMRQFFRLFSLISSNPGYFRKNTPLSRPHLEPQPTNKQRTILFHYPLIRKSLWEGSKHSRNRSTALNYWIPYI